MRAQAIGTIVLLLLTKSAFPSSNPGTYTLPWAKKSEQLTYRTCGCADSCWVAELRARNSNRLKAVLRCDCEDLHTIFPANSDEKKLQKGCSKINDSSDKLDAVSRAVKKLVESGDLNDQ